MEEELFFSGFCFRLDQSRTACAVLENGCLCDIDCDYRDCDYRQKCVIGKNVTEALEMHLAQGKP